MTAPSYKDVAAAFNAISLDRRWSAEDAAQWCQTHRVSASECVRLITASLGRLSAMARDAAGDRRVAGWADANQMGGEG